MMFIISASWTQKKTLDDQLPGDLQACHRLIAALQSQVEEQATELKQKTTELSFKDNLVEEQAHSVVELKDDNDKLAEKNIELTLKVEKLLQQLFGRRSERRVDGEGQLFLDLGEEATPEVVTALEEAVREAEEVIQASEQKNEDPLVPVKAIASSPSICRALSGSSICPRSSERASS